MQSVRARNWTTPSLGRPESLPSLQINLKLLSASGEFPTLQRCAHVISQGSKISLEKSACFLSCSYRSSPHPFCHHSIAGTSVTLLLLLPQLVIVSCLQHLISLNWRCMGLIQVRFENVLRAHPSCEEKSIYWLIDNKLPFAVPSGWKDTLFQAHIWTAAWRQRNVSGNTFKALFTYFDLSASVITFFDVQIGPCTCGSTYTVDSFIISEPIKH